MNKLKGIIWLVFLEWQNSGNIDRTLFYPLDVLSPVFTGLNFVITISHYVRLFIEKFIKQLFFDAGGV